MAMTRKILEQWLEWRDEQKRGAETTIGDLVHPGEL